MSHEKKNSDGKDRKIAKKSLKEKRAEKKMKQTLESKHTRKVRSKKRAIT